MNNEHEFIIVKEFHENLTFDISNLHLANELIAQTGIINRKVDSRLDSILEITETYYVGKNFWYYLKRDGFKKAWLMRKYHRLLMKDVIELLNIKTGES